MLKIETRVNGKFIDITIVTPSTTIDLGLFDGEEIEGVLLQLEAAVSIIRHQSERLRIYAK